MDILGRIGSSFEGEEEDAAATATAAGTKKRARNNDNDDDGSSSSGSNDDDAPNDKRVKHQHESSLRNRKWQNSAEDYMEVVGTMMGIHSSGNEFLPHHVMGQALRPLSVLEEWNPREVALFEAALYMHGKDFEKVSKQVSSKSTKQVVAFYYIWKKTSHYQHWKNIYVSDVEDDDDDDEEENSDQEHTTGGRTIGGRSNSRRR